MIELPPRGDYAFGVPILRSYLGYTGGTHLHIVSAPPHKALDYATVIRPFDEYTWASVVTSVVAVMVALIAIDKIAIKWTHRSTVNLLHQSRIISMYIGWSPGLLTLQEELRFRIRSFYCDIICNFKSTNSVPRPDGPPCIYLDPT